MTTEAYSKSTSHGQPLSGPLTAREREMLVWFLRELRPGGSYTVEHRGAQMEAAPVMVAKVMSWGGKLVNVTYKPRGG